MASRKTINKLTGLLLVPIVLVLPFMQITCGGDSPPTIGDTIERRDILPNGARWGVWGAEGYVDGELICSDIEFDWYSPRIMPGEEVYFQGGGEPMKPKLQYTIQCPYNYPYLLWASAWSWD